MNWPGAYWKGSQARLANKAAFLKLIREWLDGKLDSKFEGGESPNEVKARQLVALETIMSHPEEKRRADLHAWPCIMRLFMCMLLNKPLTEMESFPSSKSGAYTK